MFKLMVCKCVIYFERFFTNEFNYEEKLNFFVSLLEILCLLYRPRYRLTESHMAA